MNRLLRFAAIISILLMSPNPLFASYKEANRAYEAYENKDYKEALKLYTELASKGDPTAEFTIGMMYQYGQYVQNDDAEAVKWYEKAARQGHADAQLNLGLMLDSGRGGPVDHAAALSWLLKSAHMGNAKAQL